MRCRWLINPVLLGVIDDITGPSDVFSPRLSMLTEDNYQGKLEAIRQAKELGITKWKAGHVLSWVEIEMNMPMYGKACSENIKSGKVLLGLSDSELDSALGLESALHRRKLRLAIEELRDPSTISHFEAQLVDGRLLNVLTKKDMEKYLGMQKKFHQTSVLYGVELLRRLKYDKEEYISSLKESGIHGALLVLESSFNADTFATALNIPTNKSYVRRHLASELDNLIRPARQVRSAIESAAKRRGTSSNNVSRSFIRSYRGGPNTDVQDGTKGTSKRLSFRGSLGRALGRRNRQDNKKNGSTSSVDDMVIDDGHRQSENVVKDGTIV
ncbi:hypothetical protein LSH36_185g04026 [Paralvinella palmiformis]|uniref:SAM domain-containing protein n=1 Tax=Paralvinella palmiformis TaxID=53620 RepID=A0AAD9JSB9_9ANNE|nr:hypothetical protein LSH36_185g04026 [Paralvinella palmiformis]